jgi:ABC-type multidrug transport system ATPase subunit
MELKLDDINKSYGPIKALNGFSVVLDDGVYGLLGPNGAGKTTLIKIITDSIKSDSGSVYVNGRSITSIGDSYRSMLGYMPQSHGIYPSFTASQFLSYIGSLKAMEKKKIEEEVPKILKSVNLQDVAHRRIGTFSGGMKQRIMLAQALMGDPQILILDEPTAGLDPKERIRMRNLISGYALNRIVIIATHVVSDIEYIARKVILIKKGVLIHYDTSDSLCNQLEGKVYEIEASKEELPDIISVFNVCNIQKSIDNLIVRVLLHEKQSEIDLCLYKHKQVRATLEDVYLSVFEEERETEVIK